jgi:hypothetical protein
MFNLFSKKPKEPIKVKRVTCSKHGVVPNFAIHLVGGKDYDVCWDCIGEFGSQYCTVEEIEVEESK